MCCGVYFKRFAASTLSVTISPTANGFHMAGDVVTIDLDHDLSDEEIEAGEKYAHELVWKNAPVRIFNVDASELPNLPLRKKNEKLHGEVRIVEVEDGDHTEMCTCCGTHFMSTAPVGLIKVLEHVRYKSGCRITFACGAARRFLL